MKRLLVCSKNTGFLLHFAYVHPCLVANDFRDTVNSKKAVGEKDNAVLALVGSVAAGAEKERERELVRSRLILHPLILLSIVEQQRT
jgi:hypothetical protein